MRGYVEVIQGASRYHIEPLLKGIGSRVCKKCDQCQKFALNIHQSGGVLNPLSSPWPFA